MSIPSVTFIKGNTRYNTFTDWKLAVDGNPVIAIPPQKTQTVDIPGMNGVLDLSNSLRIGGGPVFGNREGSFSFYFLDIGYYKTSKWNEYLAEKMRILNQIIEIVHGRMLDVFTTFEPIQVYHGRFEVGSYDDGGSNPSKITISYSLKPDPVRIIAQESEVV